MAEVDDGALAHPKPEPPSGEGAWVERVLLWGLAIAVPLAAWAGLQMLIFDRAAPAPVVAPCGASAAAPSCAPASRRPPIEPGPPPSVELNPAPAASR